MTQFRVGMIAVFLLAAMTLACLPGALKRKSDDGKLQVLTSKDGRNQITIPAGWKEDPNLHKEAVLQASDRASEMYVVVLSASKEDFEGMTLEKYSEIIREGALQGVSSSQASTPARATLTDYPAMQCEIRGTVDNIKIVYIQVAAETPKHFYHILTWTIPSQFEKNRSQLEQVIASFKEIDSAGSAK